MGHVTITMHILGLFATQRLELAIVNVCIKFQMCIVSSVSKIGQGCKMQHYKEITDSGFWMKYLYRHILFSKHLVQEDCQSHSANISTVPQ